VTQYIVRRLLSTIPVLLVVSVTVFSMLRMLPGNVVDALLEQNPAVTQANRHELEKQYGLNRSFPSQYLHWIGGVATGDFGKSFVTHDSVKKELVKRGQITFELGVFALLYACSIAVGLGVLAAVYVDTPLDHLARALAVLGLSVPAFWWGTVAVVYPSVWWGISPAVTHIAFTSDPIGNLKQFAVPSLILGAVASASVARISRSSMLEVLGADYIRTARAKGLQGRIIVIRHALTNALLPVVAILSVLAASLLSGAVVIESIFQLPGLGLYVFDAIGKRDYPVIQSTTFVLAAVVVLINLLTDLSYGYLDPRVRLGF